MDTPPAPRRLPRAAVVSVVVAVAVVVLLVHAATATTGDPVLGILQPTTLLRRAAGVDPGPSTTDDGTVTEADGLLPDGVTVFDDRYPGVANLDGDLLTAIRAAATDAGVEGVTFSVHSAWRSPAYQEQLQRDAVAEHGSEAEAARWVASPERSLHVSGDAIDIGGTDARAWLEARGARYGLCRVYDNEPWHFERFAGAAVAGCPARYADATQDPRLQP